MGSPKVAVIGAGTLGLTVLKNLLEEGFDAIAFDKSEYIGGIWQFSENGEITSATETTEWNSCSQMSCYTDYPFPPGTPDFPSLSQIQSYLEGYCDTFSLRPHIKLQHDIKSVTRNKEDTLWKLEYTDSEGGKQVETFDKIIMATGMTAKRLMPIGIAGLENFKGRVLHGQEFKRGSEFKGKRVLVLGSSNTAMDCAVDLCAHAEKVYLSHRHGGVVIPRYSKGMPVEFSVSLRLQALSRLIGTIAPSKWAIIFNRKCLEISHDSFGTLPAEWRLNNPPDGRMCNPIINDKIVDLLRASKVSIIQSMRSVNSSGEIELVNGQNLQDVDTIILCTGYNYDFSAIPESLNPMRHSNPLWEASATTSGRKLVHLYQGIFSLDYPESLAYIGVSGFPASQMPLNDLISMALAQLWKGAVPMPSKEEMEREVDGRHKWLLEMAMGKDGPTVLPGRMNAGSWLQWLHEVAGTGVNENLGYGWRGWLYWLKEFRFCKGLMSGVNSPHIWRLYEGRRKRWDGAREALLTVNAEARRRQEEASDSVKKVR